MKEGERIRPQNNWVIEQRLQNGLALRLFKEMVKAYDENFSASR